MKDSNSLPTYRSFPHLLNQLQLMERLWPVQAELLNREMKNEPRLLAETPAAPSAITLVSREGRCVSFFTGSIYFKYKH